MQHIKLCILLGISMIMSLKGLSATQLPDPKVDSLLQIIKSQPPYEQAISAYEALSNWYMKRNPQKAIEYSHVGLEKAQAAEDSVKINAFYSILSTSHSSTGQYREALHYDQLMLDLSKNMRDQTFYAQALNNVGEDYFDMGLYTEAYDYYQKARKVAIDIDYKLLTSISTYNTGRVLMEIGQLQRATRYIRNSMDLSRKIKDEEGIAYSLNDLGKIYTLTGEYEKALDHLNEARQKSEELNIKILSPEILQNLAQVEFEINEFDKSYNYFDSAQTLYNKIGHMEGIGVSLLGKARVLVRQERGDEAEKLLEKSLELARNNKYGELAKNCYEQLSLLYESRSNFREALRLHKTLKLLEDSLFSYRKNEEFAKIQILHETEQKDSELKLMSEQVNYEEFKSNILVVVLALAAVLLFNLYRNSARRKKINNLLIAHQDEIERRSREMKGLLEMKDKFFSIISHDLRSPINALSGLLDMLNEGHISQSELQVASASLKIRLDNTRKLLDNLLDWALVQMDEMRISIETVDLSTVVDTNISFFKELNDKNIHFFNKIPEETLIRADRNMIDLVIRNIISNSIKFTADEGIIELYVEDKNADYLTVSISDNGIGMSDEQTRKLFDSAELYSTPGTANEKGTGLGLKLCREFVERMDGEIWAESEPGEGSTFKFTIKKAVTL